jgi:hypothetical protein
LDVRLESGDFSPVRGVIGLYDAGHCGEDLAHIELEFIHQGPEENRSSSDLDAWTLPLECRESPVSGLDDCARFHERELVSSACHGVLERVVFENAIGGF